MLMVTVGLPALMLPGVTIAAGALVGGGAVVTRSVAAGDVVVGNPARTIGRRDEMACSAGIFDRAYSRLDEIPETSGAGSTAARGIVDA